MSQETEVYRYTSPNGWFDLLLPTNWAIDEEAKNHTVFIANGGAGGTLRVTALAIAGAQGKPANMAAVLQEKWKQGEKPPNFTANYTDRQGAVRYDLEQDEEGKRAHLRFWELAQGNVLLVFSYTQEADKWESEAVQQELETATAIVASLNFLR